MPLGRRRRDSVLSNTNHNQGRLHINFAVNYDTYTYYPGESRPLNQNLDQGRSNYIQFGGKVVREYYQNDAYLTGISTYYNAG